MAKIHTHYDNLKVSRHAPQEVIRASYKALSQKYHPDKNPGDEKAARIMAIVNTAYNILSDPMRRKEHDDWIASEEWEVEWVESSNAKDGTSKKGPEAAWEAQQPPPRPRRARLARDSRWWLGLMGAFIAGASVAVMLGEQPQMLPSALAWSGMDKAEAKTVARADTVSAAHADEPGRDASTDGWAKRSGSGASSAASTGSALGVKEPPPEVRALAVTQLVVPEHAPDCGTDLHTLSAPSGDPWPVESSYLPGYPLGNDGTEMQVLIDNSGNASPVFVKLYDLDRRSNVRHAYVQSRSTFNIDKLAAGKYEVRYQNIIVGASKTDCDANRRTALYQATAPVPEA